MTIGFKPTFSALVTTNLVCGSGPSAASTSTSAPSTMPRMRSTSPPKSAWPGVSTILMRVSCQQNRRDLGQDGDAALALEIVGIQRPLGDTLVLAERARLLQQPVDQRGLAVVDMGNDGDIAQFHRGSFFVSFLAQFFGGGAKLLRARAGPHNGPQYSGQPAVRNATAGLRVLQFRLVLASPLASFH